MKVHLLGQSCEVGVAAAHHHSHFAQRRALSLGLSLELPKLGREEAGERDGPCRLDRLLELTHGEA